MSEPQDIHPSRSDINHFTVTYIIGEGVRQSGQIAVESDIYPTSCYRLRIVTESVNIV